MTENRDSVHNVPAVFPERRDTADGQEVALVEKDLPSPVGVLGAGRAFRSGSARDPALVSLVGDGQDFLP